MLQRGHSAGADRCHELPQGNLADSVLKAEPHPRQDLWDGVACVLNVLHPLEEILERGAWN